jgi:hypothetical protein
MRKLFLTLAGAAALVGGSAAANAAALVVSPTVLTPPASGNFGNAYNNVAVGTLFNDTFTFSIGGGSTASADAQLSTILLSTGTGNVSFTCDTCSIYLDNPANAFVETLSGTQDAFALAPMLLAPGITHTIFVNGQLLSTSGSYAGTVNVAAVPEATTWAMMLLGFGAMGFAIRRRRRPVLAQVA